MKRKFLKIGLAILFAGFIFTLIAFFCLFDSDNPQQSAMFFIMTFSGSLVMFIGLGFSMYDMAKSVLNRLKEAQQREQAKYDKQRQTRQNKDASDSP